MNKWYEKSGECSDVVLSTRIRFARNMSDYPFPCKLNSNVKSQVANDIKRVLSNKSFANYNFRCLNIASMNRIDTRSLVECHLVSPEFIKKDDSGVVFISSEDNISIMVNEEDHIRMQVMKEGLSLEETYNVADELDNKLDKNLKFAFNENLGYLTQCLTNLGTGMRASVMLHLPALKECGMIEKISSNLIKLGLTMRGLYGEGTEPKGDIYQISNQVTLGISEKTAIKNLNDITMQIINQERNYRKELSKNIQVTDAICRSLGILKTAKLLSNDEFMKLISNIRLGLSMGIIKGTSYDVLNNITIKAQPYMLMKEEKSELTSVKRDQKRAMIMNTNLQNTEIL